MFNRKTFLITETYLNLHLDKTAFLFCCFFFVKFTFSYCFFICMSFGLCHGLFLFLLFIIPSSIPFCLEGVVFTANLQGPAFPRRGEHCNHSQFCHTRVQFYDDHPGHCVRHRHPVTPGIPRVGEPLCRRSLEWARPFSATESWRKPPSYSSLQPVIKASLLTVALLGQTYCCHLLSLRSQLRSTVEFWRLCRGLNIESCVRARVVWSFAGLCETQAGEKG